MKYRIEIEFDYPEELSQSELDDLSDDSLRCMADLPNVGSNWSVTKHACTRIDAKASLIGKLEELGIEVVAGKVRKSDIKKALAEKATSNKTTTKEFLEEFEEWSGGYTPDEVPLEAFWYKCKELGVPFELAKKLVKQFGLYYATKQELTEEDYADECTKRKLSSFKFDL